MKKAILCAILLCLILIGCATVTNQPTTGQQMNATTLPSSSTTTTFPPTRPPTRPPTFGDPICLMGHAFENGICKNCKAKDPNHTGTYPTENFCAQGHTYAGPYCVYCLAVNPDYAKCESTHTYQNGYCIYCGCKQSAGDVGATQPTTSRPAYLCAMGDHEIKDGYCIHCGRVEPKDEDAKLVVNGKDITEGNYVKINEGYSNASIPLTAVLTELGIDWKWETDKILRIGSGEYVGRLDLTDPTFGWLIPPGTLGSVREVMDGEVIIDEQALNIYFFRAQNISISTDYETNTILITSPPTYITELITPQGAGYSGKPVPGPYVIKEVNGQFYIDFGEGNQRHYLTDPCLVYPFGLRFDSVEDLYNSLMTGDFTMQELQVIRARFELDENHGFLLPNPRQLWDLDTPEGVSVEIEIRAREYMFYIRSANNVPIEEQFTWKLNVLTKAQYDRYMQNRAEREYVATLPIPERDAVAYDEEVSSRTICRYVQYTREHDGKQLSVEETYYVRDQEMPSAASSISVLCHDNGMYYQLYHSMATDNIPTTQWLAQFELIPYTP